ncbi:MAG: hypothetical protein LBT71_03105 [Azoarcus sp.]|jgi:hypothetical protein|nr:hypothetical protein [Azoarcus sp.]
MVTLLKTLPPLSYEVPQKLLDAIADGIIVVSDDILPDINDPEILGRVPASVDNLEFSKKHVEKGRYICSETSLGVSRFAEHCWWTELEPEDD